MIALDVKSLIRSLGSSTGLGGLASAVGFVRSNGLLAAILSSAEGRAGLGIVAFFVVLAAIAPYVAPYNPYATDPSAILQPPSPQHLFGTDESGHDLFSQTIVATRISLIVGFAATLITVLIGTLAGLAAGYMGGLVDEALMRFADFFLVVPPVVLMVVLGAVIGPSLTNVIVAIGLLSWSPVARVVRSMVLSIKEWPFVEASRGLGAGGRVLVFKHILPQTMPVVLANAMTSVANAVFAHAALAFLGVASVNDLSWGTILHFAYTSGALTAGKWWYFLPPGLMLLLMVYGFMLLGYPLEEYYNPRLREGSPEI
ncbi:MAG: ABC transporter permease [Desulfurococcaceae archaeon]